jgi:hypothetical protein
VGLASLWGSAAGLQVLVGEDRVPLEPTREYTLATRSYTAEGHDGYDCFRHMAQVIDKEIGSLLSTIVICALREVTAGPGPSGERQFNIFLFFSCR